MVRTSPALSTRSQLELTLPGDRATSLRRRGLPGPPGASENGALAQLGERRNGIAEVAGSIPACSTKKMACVREDAGFLFHDARLPTRVRHSVRHPAPQGVLVRRVYAPGPGTCAN